MNEKFVIEIILVVSFILIPAIIGIIKAVKETDE
jgi:hypothetical protein